MNWTPASSSLSSTEVTTSPEIYSTQSTITKKAKKPATVRSSPKVKKTTAATTKNSTIAVRRSPNIKKTTAATTKKVEVLSAKWSQYKKHNTAKFLVAIAPHGRISFLSAAWTRMVSCKQIVQQPDWANRLGRNSLSVPKKVLKYSMELCKLVEKLEEKVKKNRKILEQKVISDTF